MFETFDALLLARIQFAFTVAFHFIFPAFTIGLSSYLAVLNGLYLWKKDERYLRLFKFWIKIFAVSFGHGRRVGHHHVLSVRHELVGVFRYCRARDRAAHGL